MKNNKPKQILKTVESRKQILVVEDNPLLLKFLRIVLESQYEITTSPGGEGVFKLFADQRMQYALIIADLNMPEVSGVDIYRYIAKKFPGQERKVLFITGGAYDKTTEIFLQSIDNPILEKPFSSTALLEEVGQIIA